MAIRPIGMLITKTRRQSTAASRPPRMRPRNEPGQERHAVDAEGHAALVGGKTSVMIAAELAIIMAPPAAWTMRKAMISVAR